MAAVNLRHIEIFHAVMTAGSLTEAAHLLIIFTANRQPRTGAL